MKKLIFPLLFTVCFSLQAQWYAELTNPSVYSEIIHPPQLGLFIQRVAIIPDNPPLSSELTDYLTAHFVSNGDIEVVDREHLYEILREQNLSLTGRIDKNSAVKLGKILGAAALITVHVYNDEYKKEMKREEIKGKNGITVKYTAKVEWYLKFSVKTVDLQTGKIFSAKIFDLKDYAENWKYREKPEYPDIHSLRNRVYAKAVEGIDRLYFPWTERVSFVFYNSKKCGMKMAYSFIKTKQYNKALEQSLSALNCFKNSKANSKNLSRAYYNVGVCHYFLKNYDKAREYFSKAYSVKSYSTYKDAIDKVNLTERVEREYFLYLKSRADSRTRDYSRNTEMSESPKTHSEELSEDDIVKKLKKLKLLFEQGLITEDEYKAKKKELLDRL